MIKPKIYSYRFLLSPDLTSQPDLEYSGGWSCLLTEIFRGWSGLLNGISQCSGWSHLFTVIFWKVFMSQHGICWWVVMSPHWTLPTGVRVSTQISSCSCSHFLTGILWGVVTSSNWNLPAVGHVSTQEPSGRWSHFLTGIFRRVVTSPHCNLPKGDHASSQKSSGGWSCLHTGVF